MGMIILGTLILLSLLAVVSSIKIVGQAEVMVIERWGRFNRIARSGLNILIPIMERPKTIDVRYFESDVSGLKRITAGSTARIDLREQVLNFPSQPVITKDNVTIDIDAVLYYRVADPQKATYSIQNLPFALETLTRTTLRNIVGEMELDQTLASRDLINKKMREVIEEASIGWGVDVTRVELQSIDPPKDIQQSMELVMRAERERRATVTTAEANKRSAILQAEGQREAQIRKAEGEQQASILRAQGLAEARLAMAQAEAEALRRIAESLPENQVAMYLLGQKYLDALPQLTQGRGTTVFLPAEASGMMGSIGALREMMFPKSGGEEESKSGATPARGYRAPMQGIPSRTGGDGEEH
jgi:regulator of protease activity HflC (stomatin/prohibitin superfamily)